MKYLLSRRIGGNNSSKKNRTRLVYSLFILSSEAKILNYLYAKLVVLE